MRISWRPPCTKSGQSRANQCVFKWQVGLLNSSWLVDPSSALSHRIIGRVSCSLSSRICRGFSRIAHSSHGVLWCLSDGGLYGSSSRPSPSLCGFRCFNQNQWHWWWFRWRKIYGLPCLPPIACHSDSAKDGYHLLGSRASNCCRGICNFAQKPSSEYLRPLLTS